ncbi:hypothetical protein DAPPUDRAFT_244701 [Daphnia pulex]|uniref:W2 domain-containing protein n=1 Tax=Daphnia pulex TaxID=6669 RepID=E9GLK6_DAPPU|nr:hypothetical protein DAPPUDRAFT_244701 [Daphnia pulex]|eukprot:EFX79527.1 hypothetical protein DAPPUDRAFT_244701 [Daphnia pulex]
MDVLKRYVDNIADRELQLLYAVQALVTQRQHPKGLMQGIFETLHDSNVVSEEGFESWVSVDDPLEREGKAVALKMITPFFTWLKEADSEIEMDKKISELKVFNPAVTNLYKGSSSVPASTDNKTEGRPGPTLGGSDRSVTNLTNNNPINNQRFYAEDSFSDVNDRFKERLDSMDYAYNNGMADPMQQQLQGMNGQQQQPNFNGGTGGPIRNLPMNKTTRGLPPVLPDPSVIQQQQQQHPGQPPLNNMMMMNADANNPLYGHANNVAAPQQATTAPTSAPLSSHFSFFEMGGNNSSSNNNRQGPVSSRR